MHYIQAVALFLYQLNDRTALQVAARGSLNEQARQVCAVLGNQPSPLIHLSFSGHSLSLSAQVPEMQAEAATQRPD